MKEFTGFLGLSSYLAHAVVAKEGATIIYAAAFMLGLFILSCILAPQSERIGA